MWGGVMWGGKLSHFVQERGLRQHSCPRVQKDKGMRSGELEGVGSVPAVRVFSRKLILLPVPPSRICGFSTQWPALSVCVFTVQL